MNFVVGFKRKPSGISGLENEDDDDVSVKQKNGNKKGFSRMTMNVEQVKDWKDLIIKNPKQWKDYPRRKATGRGNITGNLMVTEEGDCRGRLLQIGESDHASCLSHEKATRNGHPFS
nr:protein OSB3, chloroplastic/mitochondrial-like [Ipomoea batatas]